MKKRLLFKGAILASIIAPVVGVSLQQTSSKDTFANFTSAKTEVNEQTYTVDDIYEGMYLGLSSSPNDILYNYDISQQNFNDDWYSWNDPIVNASDDGELADITLSYDQNINNQYSSSTGIWLYDQDGNPLYVSSGIYEDGPMHAWGADSIQKITNVSIDYVFEDLEGNSTDGWYSEDLTSTTFNTYATDDEITRSLVIEDVPYGTLTINEIYFGYVGKTSGTKHLAIANNAGDKTYTQSGNNEITTTPPREDFDYQPEILTDTFEWDNEYQTIGEAKFNIDIKNGTGDMVYENINSLTITADEKNFNGTGASNTVELSYEDVTNYDTLESSGGNAYMHTFMIRGKLVDGELMPLDSTVAYDNLNFTFDYNNSLADTIYADEFDPELLTANVDSSYFGTDYLFRSPEYSKPVISTSFMFSDIDAHAATFSFTYWQGDDETEARGNESEFYYFDKVEGVHLFSDLNDDGHYTENEELTTDTSYIEGADVSGQEIASVLTPTNTVFYRIENLEDNTRYDDFSIFIDSTDKDGNSIESIEAALDEAGEEGLVAGSPEYSTLYTIPSYRGVFTTPHDIQYYINIIIILLIILIIIILIIAGIYVVYWWHRHVSLGVYFDSEDSLINGEFIINLIHANRNKLIWNAHEDDIKLYASGRQIDVIVRRDSSLPYGYKIFLTENTSNKKVILSIMSASKYNQYFIGVGSQQFHAHVISDKKAKRIAKMFSKESKEIYTDNKNRILDELGSEYRKNHIVEHPLHETLWHISETKNKKDSLRLQVLMPEQHSTLEHFDPKSEKIMFYHIIDGLAYKLDHHYIGHFGTLFEYTLNDLEPNTIYCGISVSYDGGKTIIPTTAVYGVTKDEHNHVQSKTHAALATKPSTGKGIPMWTKEEALSVVGEETFNAILEILIKKHYERDNNEIKLPLNKAVEYYEHYATPWLENAEKELAKRKEKEIFTDITPPLTIEEISEGYEEGFDVEVEDDTLDSQEEVREWTSTALKKLNKPELLEIALKYYDEASLNGQTKAQLVDLILEAE